MQFWKKAMENVRKHGDIKLGTTEARNNYLVNEQITKYFWDNLLQIETTRTQMLMNKPFYLGLSVCMIFGIIIWNIICLLIKGKIAWSANNDKRIQSVYSTETYASGKSKNIVRKKQVIDRVLMFYFVSISVSKVELSSSLHLVSWTISLWVLRSVRGPSSSGVGNFKNYVEKVTTS